MCGEGLSAQLIPEDNATGGEGLGQIDDALVAAATELEGDVFFLPEEAAVHQNINAAQEVVCHLAAGVGAILQQLILQTERLEVTRQVFVLDHENSLERELLLLKVAADVHNRSELREIASIYKAKIIDFSPDSMVLELTGRPEKVDAFLKILADYKILEQCRTGVTALERGGMHQHMQKPPQEVRAAQLPLPGTHCPQ